MGLFSGNALEQARGQEAVGKARHVASIGLTLASIFENYKSLDESFPSGVGEVFRPATGCPAPALIPAVKLYALLCDSLLPKKFDLKYVQRLVSLHSVCPYTVPDELGILLNSMKRLQFLSWTTHLHRKCSSCSEMLCKQRIWNLLDRLWRSTRCSVRMQFRLLVSSSAFAALRFESKMVKNDAASVTDHLQEVESEIKLLRVMAQKLLLSQEERMAQKLLLLKVSMNTGSPLHYFLWKWSYLLDRRLGMLHQKRLIWRIQMIYMAMVQKHEKAGILRSGSYSKMDGSFYCVCCGKVNWLIGSWLKQMLVAKDARGVDVLCNRLSLSHKILKGTKRYKDLHSIVNAAVNKLNKEVGPLDKVSAVMARGIVNWLACGTEVQKLCVLAVETVGSMVSGTSNPFTDSKLKSSGPQALRIRF